MILINTNFFSKKFSLPCCCDPNAYREKQSHRPVNERDEIASSFAHTGPLISRNDKAVK